MAENQSGDVATTRRTAINTALDVAENPTQAGAERLMTDFKQYGAACNNAGVKKTGTLPLRKVERNANADDYHNVEFDSAELAEGARAVAGELTAQADDGARDKPRRTNRDELVADAHQSLRESQVPPHTVPKREPF